MMQNKNQTCPVFVDALVKHPITKQWRFGKACHMYVACGEDIEVLHRFAQSLGLKREWFQNGSVLPHYDLTEARRAKAVELGAVEASREEIVSEIRKYRELKNGR